MDLVRVALDLPLHELFDYLPPRGRSAATLRPGMRVRVPFRGIEKLGVVVEITRAESRQSRREWRPITDVLDAQSIFGDALFATLLQAASYYQHPLGEVLATALPPMAGHGPDRQAAMDQVYRRVVDAVALKKLKPESQAYQVYDLLAEGPQSWRELSERTEADARSRKRLLDLGLIEPIDLSHTARQALVLGPEPNPAQQAAIDAIGQTQGQYSCLVLEGVTGSGKTEVYLRAIEAVLHQGRQALLLVPEIGLTPQLTERFRERLGFPILRVHSGLSDRERAQVFERCQQAEPLVLVGTRSAVFAPFADLGLIVVDEEHDASYKQQEGFRYHARDVALMRAHRLGIPTVLGSATPSFETLHNLEQGRYTRLSLPKRAQHAKPPAVRLLDLNVQKPQHGLAREAIEAIQGALDRGEQAMVFRNRRGYAPGLQCELCGHMPNCERCERPLTWHKSEARLVCHYCQRVQKAPPACPNDHSPLRPFGHGTERIEEGLKELFPDITIQRFDRDSIRGSQDFEAAMRRARHGERMILVGTQMLAKGHDLPLLTVVVVTDADQGLLSTDVRAGERAAQLLIQVSGRAGRAQRPGLVLVQTRYPEHAFFKSLLSGGYRAFAAAEMTLRRSLDLPPFSAQALLRADSPDEQQAIDFLDAAKRQLTDPGKTRGPMPAPHAKRANRYRAQLWLDSPDRRQRADTIRQWQTSLPELAAQFRVRWSLEIDPISDD